MALNFSEYNHVKQPLETRLKLEFTKASVDATESLLPDLLSFSYSDKEKNEADEISISLKDDTGKWAGTWMPNGGEVVKAYIIKGRVSEKEKSLYCGKFFVDSLSCAGSPRTFEMKAVSVPLDTPIRKTERNRAWEDSTIGEIAGEIARNNGLGFIIDAPEDQTIDRVNQESESDLAFLLRICEDVGYSVKVTDDTLVVFDQAEYESRPPAHVFELGKSNIISWNFSAEQSETFKTATVKYRDPKQKKEGSAGGYVTDGDATDTTGGNYNPAVMTYTYTEGEEEGVTTEGDAAVEENQGQVLEVKKRAKSVEQAKRLAKAALRMANMRSKTGSITLIGDVTIVAGIVIAFKGFGSFDGNYFVETATHSVGTGGYTTALDFRKVRPLY